MANTMVLSQDEALEFVAFLVTGARCRMDEAVDYGPMRLLEAAERLCRWVAPRSDDAATRSLFERLAVDIPPQIGRRNADPTGYLAFMDESCRRIAGELLDRAGRG